MISSFFAAELHLVGNECKMLEISGGETVEELQHLMQSRMGVPLEDQIVLVASRRSVGTAARSPKAVARNYSMVMTAREFEDLQFIVRTLGFKSLAKIFTEKKSLERAGDRIDHVHPFRFLEAILTDDELIAGVHNIRHRSFVWGEFSKGLKDALKEESERGNLTAEQITDFAARLSIDERIIIPSINTREWGKLMDVLLGVIKPNADSGKYDL